MADKRISQLVERTDIANNDVLPIVASGATTTNKVTISTIQDWMQDNLDVGVTSVGITLGTSGTDVNVTGSPITTSGNITINIPDASASNRGVVTTGSQVFGGVKTFANGLALPSLGGTNQVTRIVNIGTIHEGSAGSNQIGFNNSNNIYFGKGLSNGGVIQWTNAAVRYYTLPDADGTLALASQLDGYVTLGTAQTITGQKTFSTSGSSDTAIINHGSGSGIALNITKAGNGEGLRVAKTSGSGNAVTITGGTLSAEAATLTGALNGTNAAFTGGATFGSTVRPTTNFAADLGTSSVRWADIFGSSLNVTSLISSQVNTILADGAGVVLQGYIDNNLRIAARGSGYNSGSRGGLLASTGDFSSSVTAGVSGGRSFSANHSSPYSFLYSTINGASDIAFDNSAGSLVIYTGGNNRVTIASSGAATFSSSGIANGTTKFAVNGAGLISSFGSTGSGTDNYIRFVGNTNNFDVGINGTSWGVADAGVAYRLLITQAGNVGIGTDSPTNLLHVRSTSNGNTAQFEGVGASDSFINVSSTGVQNTYLGFNNSGSTNGVGIPTGVSYLANANAYPLAFSTNNTERMRITSLGELLWNVTGLAGSNLNTGGVLFRNNSGKYVQISTGLTSDASLMLFYKSDGAGGVTNTGSISTSGNLTLYNTTSDYRLKEDLQDFNALEKIANLKIYDFAWKHDQSRSYGVLAHELAEVLPYSVFGEKDAIEEDEEPKLQQVDYSKIVPILIKAIQEQQEQIDSLKNQIK
jgi:hypothetical protein